MAKRSDSVARPAIILIVGGVFLLIWITTAASHHAPAFFPLFGLVALGVLVFTLGGSIVKTLSEQSRNQTAPVLTTAARIVSKRTEVRSQGKSHSTNYFATFELASGERMELELEGQDFGLLAEGDDGDLRYQGSWFLGFERKPLIAPGPLLTAGESLVCEYCGSINRVGATKCSSCGSARLVPQKSPSTPSS